MRRMTLRGPPKLPHCRYITSDGTVSFSPWRLGGSLGGGVGKEEIATTQRRKGTKLKLGGSRGLGGLRRLSICWSGKKIKNHSRKVPAIWTSARVCKSAMCSQWAISTLLAHAREKHYDHTTTRKIYANVQISCTPTILLHHPPPPTSCLLFFFLKKNVRGEKSECSARGGRWRKPHFFRRAAASGLLRWL